MADLSPVAKALLETIAGPESAGAYDVMYGGGKFSDFTDHPRVYNTIMSGPNKGQKSSAAGKYQFLGSTWDDVASRNGLTDFSPESQDKAAWALATEEYKRDTGRDLESDLAAGDLSRVAPSLRNQWTSLPGGIEQGINGSAFANAYASNLGAPANAADAGIMKAMLPNVGPTGGPQLNGGKTGIMGAFAQGLGNFGNMMGQQAQPLMRASQQAGGNIMRAANPLGTVKGRTAIIDSGLKQIMTGSTAGSPNTSVVQSYRDKGASPSQAYAQANSAAVERAIMNSKNPEQARRLNARS